MNLIIIIQTLSRRCYMNLDDFMFVIVQIE